MRFKPCSPFLTANCANPHKSSRDIWLVGDSDRRPFRVCMLIIAAEELLAKQLESNEILAPLNN